MLEGQAAVGELVEDDAECPHVGLAAVEVL